MCVCGGVRIEGLDRSVLEKGEELVEVRARP